MTVLHLLLFLSGAATLLYEVVWARRFALIFGSTVHSVSAVLAALMAGLALGGWAAGRWGRRAKDPLALYGALELGVAVAAASVPFALAALAAWAEARGTPPLAVRFLLSFLILLPPCVLAGATFPMLSQTFTGAAETPAAVSRLYAANLAGAAFGTAAGAFALLAWLGLKGTYGVGLALSATAGGLALWSSRRGERTAGARRRERGPAEPDAAPGSAGSSAEALPASVFLGVMGFLGMAYEVVWTRLLVPSSNNSAYGFASVLLVFLGGSAFGAGAAARLPLGRRASLGGLQGLSAVAGLLAYGLFEVSQLLQVRWVDYAVSGVSPYIGVPLAEAFVVLLPLAVLQGAAWPAALASAGPRPPVGTLYAWNTAGAIAGSLAAGFWWIPAWGVQPALLAIVTLAAVSGAAFLASDGWDRRVLAAAAACLLLPLLARARLGGDPLPRKLIYDWASRTPQGERRVRWYAEDLEATVAVEERGGTKMLLINGVGVAGYANVTKLLAHIPLALHPAPERALVICFGLGTTFRSALSHPVRVDAVDLSPSVLQAFKFFYKDADAKAADPRARRFVNDGRNHLLSDREGYDVVMVDPSPPLYAAGTVNLYDRDFFALARRRLRPRGLMAVWLPDYPASEFLAVVRSFAEAFPDARLFRFNRGVRGLILVGGKDGVELDRLRADARLARAEVRADLRELDEEFKSPEAFWALDLGPAAAFADHWGTVPAVTDDFPRIEHPYYRSWRKAYYRTPALLDAAPRR